ncbi:MAG: glycine--tRNA ligase [Dehalococcoidia bacterium]|nr:glycine--tRNA ligase [Dehalococcoidia bacterium]
MADMETIVSLAKRRGFIFQSSEIYGGLASTWDYGPLGVELKRNVKEAWWRTFVHQRDDMVGLDASILMARQVWAASGHEKGFSDPLVECKSCNHRFRADQINPVEAAVANGKRLLEQIAKLSDTVNEDLSLHRFIIDDVRMETYNDLTLAAAANFPNDPILNGQLINMPDAVTQTFGSLVGQTFNLGAMPPGLLTQRLQEHLTRLSNRLETVLNTPGLRSATVGSTPSCPDCGGKLTPPRQFNLMFKTFLGPIEDDTAQTYLRPETAQGIFVNFNNVITTTRRKLPFGVGQIGKAFRNEITVGNFIFRTREFEQMEIEFFVKPGTDDDWHQRWIKDCLAWYTGLGIAPDHLHIRQHEASELSHYSKATSDIEYAFPWGWGEIQGIANRTDFDLNAHSKASGKDLTYFDEESKEHFTPYVIEPSAGVDRALLAFLLDAYHEEDVPAADGKSEKRVVLKLHPALAPVKVAVLPLSRNERLTPKAREVYDLVRSNFVCQYDDAQSIGRRYRRQDEIGTPLCVTVDFQTIDDNAVTIRDRDTMHQERIAIPELASKLRERISG